MKNKETRLVSICTSILIFCSILFSYNQFTDYKENVSLYNEIANSMDTQLKTYMKSIFDENIDKGKLNITFYTDIIHKNLLDKYGDNLDILEDDISKPLENTDLVQIIDKELDKVFINHNNNSNKPIVASLENIIWNRSMPFEYKEGTTIVSWDDFISKHYNTELSMTAVDAIKNMNRERYKYIFWETIDNPNPQHKKIKSMSIDDIINVYNDEGLEGLSSYELLVPVYITETGDIFGTNDSSTSGHKIDNYKIIVIQRMNVYDMLMNNINNLNTFTHELEVVEINCLNNINNSVFKMIQCIIFIFIILICSSYIQKRFKNN